MISQLNKNHWILLGTFLWPIVIITRFFLERISPIAMIKLFLVTSFFLFVISVITTFKKRRIKLLAIQMVILSLCPAFPRYFFLDEIVLGKKIGDTYVAEAPGFMELKLYSKGTCIFTCVGIQGVTNIFYAPFKKENDRILVITNERLLELEGMSIFVNQVQYTLESRKPKP